MIVALVIGSQDYVTYMDNHTLRPVVFKSKQACENVAHLLANENKKYYTKFTCILDGIRSKA